MPYHTFGLNSKVPSISYSGNTPLHAAMEYQFHTTKIIKFILKTLEKLPENFVGLNPLFYAICFGNLKGYKYLIRHLDEAEREGIEEKVIQDFEKDRILKDKDNAVLKYINFWERQNTSFKS